MSDADLARAAHARRLRSGACRACGVDRMVNRKQLCYPCWVECELRARGWEPGARHPAWCRCELGVLHQSPDRYG